MPDYFLRGIILKKISIFSTGLYVVTALFIIIGSCKISYSQSFSSPLSSGGGVDTHVYKSDSVLFDAVILDDGSGVLSPRTITSGMSMLHSPYLSMFYIPLKYDFSNRFQIFMTLPYLTKTLVFDNNHYVKSGYGDTMFGITRSFEKIFFFSSKTTARITIPTGNVNAQDFDYFIPMGYGGYTTSLQESLSFNEINAKYTTIRMFIGAIFVYYFTSSQQIDSTSKYTFDNNYSLSLMAGAEFHVTENCDLQFKINYIDIKGRKYKTESSGWNSAHDSVKQLNLMPFVKYRLMDEVSGKFGIIYPVKTFQDSNLAYTYDPKWKMVMGIEKRFTDVSSEKK